MESLLLGAKNMKYVGDRYFPPINQVIPFYELKDISDEEWNRRAKAQQAAMKANESVHAIEAKNSKVSHPCQQL